MTCTSGATCPSIHECGHALDGPGYLIVGKDDTALHAEHHGGNVGPGEQVVWVPDAVIDSITAPLKARIAELEDNLSAIRSWTRSRLETLTDAQRDWRQSSQNAGKIAILDDLTRVLDHLVSIPRPADAADSPKETKP